MAAEVPPGTSTDIAAFLAAGCIHDGGGGLLCSPGCIEAAGMGSACSAKASAIGCDEPLRVDHLLDGLTPRASIAPCYGADTGVVASSGCLFSRSKLRRFVIASGGRLEIVRDEAAFVKRFAPVESAEEALAFALALTEAHAFFDGKLPRDAVPYPGELPTTSVDAVASGWVVHLFEYEYCGCGPHDEVVVDVLVTREGKVKMGGRRPVWRYPKEDGSCYD
jgi:hypothetical protein